MKRLCYVKLLFLVCGIAPFLFGNCASLVEKAGQVLDGSAFDEKKIAVYRAAKKQGAITDMMIQEVQNRAGERSVVISLEEFPAMKIRGSAPNEQGDFIFSSLDYLGSNVQGWNEYRLDLSGYGNLRLGETTAVLSVPNEIEAVQISWGRIRRYDTRITGTEALTNLRDRRERITALAEWVNSREDAPYGLSLNEFEKYWKPLLFPELLSKKKRPEGWQQEGDEWIKAEDIRWNTSYTGRVFPEILWPIRNSGTLLRDWEEALSWVYMECEWERIMGLFSQGIVLTRTKK
ncbi:MAG: hypothetical protein LBH97_00635 [Treponema sp.]|jgi:hypothetical protein|nr:hypothetical protein [Treponema sp.]